MCTATILSVFSMVQRGMHGTPVCKYNPNTQDFTMYGQSAAMITTIRTEEMLQHSSFSFRLGTLLKTSSCEQKLELQNS